ncbi:MAG: sugar phosphate nucleotidyltransferase [Candidatus Hydrogenedentota bacterium]
MSLFVLLPGRNSFSPETQLLGLTLRDRMLLTASRAGFSHFVASDGPSPVPDIGLMKMIDPRRGASLPDLGPHRALFAAPNVVFTRSGLDRLLATPLAQGHALIDDGGVVLMQASEPGWIGEVMAKVFSGLKICDAIGESPSGSLHGAGLDYIVLNSKADLEIAEEMLLRSLVKDTEGFMSRHVERKISLSMTRRLVKRGVSPTQMTLVSLAIGITAAPFFLFQRPAWQLMGALLFLLHSILDGCDGELARLTFRESRFGGLLDFWGDNIVHSAIFACIGAGWAHAAGSGIPIVLALAAVIGTFASAGIVYFRTMRRPDEAKSNGPLFQHVVARPDGRTERAMDFLARRDFIYLVVILAAFGKAHWFLILASAGAPLFALLLLFIPLMSSHHQDEPGLKAVILAAGRGSRLADQASREPKCLLNIHGHTVMEAIVEAARGAGIHSFVIVTGYEAEAIRRELGDGSRLGVQIEYVHNDRWNDLANGHSILAARSLIGNRFVILMSDHVFESTMLRELLDAPPPERGCVLLTDPRIESIFDIGDATKVRTDGEGRIVSMGKDLEDYDAVDTGIFLATRDLLDALDEAHRDGESSLTAANVRLASRGIMRALALKSVNAKWFDIDTPESLAHCRARFDIR